MSEHRQAIANRGSHPGETNFLRRRALTLAATLRGHLFDEVMPFWERYSVLPDGRGFWPALARDGARMGDGAHAVVSVARLVYSFAVVAELRGSDRHLAHAVAGARVLMRYYDEQAQGWNWRIPAGNPKPDLTRRPYGAIFAVYALATCGRVADEPEFVDRAAASFRVLWANGRESAMGGFWHELSAAWAPLALHHRLDTHLHAMEASSALLAATGDSEWRKCLTELSLLVAGRALDPGYGCVREQFLPDWTEDVGVTGGQVSYGHNLEAAWFLGQMADLLEEPGLADVGRVLLDFVLAQERHEAEQSPPNPIVPDPASEEAAVNPGAMVHGGFRASGRPPRSRRHDGQILPHFSTGSGIGGPLPSRIRPLEYIWWVQTEAIGALAHYYARRPTPGLLQRLEDLWEFAYRYFHDPVYGGWYTRLDSRGQPIDDRKGSDWKAGYHVVQACVQASAALDGLLRPGSVL